MISLSLRALVNLGRTGGFQGEERRNGKPARGHSVGPILTLTGQEEDEKLEVKEGNVSGDGVAPSKELSNSCRAGWRLRITKPWKPCKGQCKQQGRCTVPSEEESTKCKGKCWLLFLGAGQ